MKKIILCADDYGQNAAVSQAIIQLLERQRLSAASCLTTSPDWGVAAASLVPFKDATQFGLHFNLTEGEPLSSVLKKSHGFLPLPRLLLRAKLHQLDIAAIQAELLAQLNAFSEAMGHLPHFVDGHQHIHQFPGVRDALLNVYESHLRGTGCYLRCTAESLRQWLRGNAHLKRMVLQWSGALAFQKILRQRNIPHNTSFSGVYAFAKAKEYSQFFPSFLQEVSEGGLILCHPGLVSVPSSDPLRDVRYQEFNYFLSEQFVQDCHTHSVRYL